MKSSNWPVPFSFYKACEGIRVIMKEFPDINWLDQYLYDAQKITLKQAATLSKKGFNIRAVVLDTSF